MKLVRSLVLPVALMLAGCGTNRDSTDLEAPIQTVVERFTPAALRQPSLNALNTNAALSVRAKLEAEGRPTLLVTHPTLRFEGLMSPIGQNAGVVTWASPTGEAVSLRDGMVVASRGFGPDLMSSAGPSTARVQTGTGATRRSYFYLDGADARRAFDFDCTLAKGVSGTAYILGKSYATTKVTESCSHPLGSFVNEYWFDNRLILRQSRQAVTLGMESVLIQRIID
jgi:hypothetical protein